MRIGVITYFKVLNFGANLQAVSTYFYLKKHGHEPFFINYLLDDALRDLQKHQNDEQWNEHLCFINKIIIDQTQICQKAEDILQVVSLYKLDGIIIGSDALLQHHPFITRIKKGRRKPFFIMPIRSDRLFPNLCWGVGLSDKVPLALMSVSSQNSEYDLFLSSTKRKMQKSLENFKYISVRDIWTQDMLKCITNNTFPVTPDPVFAFNQNAAEIIPSKEDILERFSLPKNYVLLSLFSQVLTENVIAQLKDFFNKIDVALVVLPLPTGVHFKHNADIEIKCPLSPIDWYALIKYSYAYIGSNMHPIVTCLHNAIPCFSIDNWGRSDFWGNKKNDGSSKVEHIMTVFGVADNHRFIQRSRCDISALEIFDKIQSFPKEVVARKAQ